MRLIDADVLMEHVYRDELDSRELIAEMVKNAPTAHSGEDYRLMCEELRAINGKFQDENNRLKGEIKALAFAVRCNGISGNDVRYEDD